MCVCHTHTYTCVRATHTCAHVHTHLHTCVCAHTYTHTKKLAGINAVTVEYDIDDHEWDAISYIVEQSPFLIVIKMLCNKINY